jgi:hypothetical protein
MLSTLRAIHEVASLCRPEVKPRTLKIAYVGVHLQSIHHQTGILNQSKNIPFNI